MEDGEGGSKCLIMSGINLFFFPVLLPTHKQNAFSTCSFCTFGVTVVFAGSCRGLQQGWGRGAESQHHGGCGNCCFVPSHPRLSAPEPGCDRSITASTLHILLIKIEMLLVGFHPGLAYLRIPLQQLAFVFFHPEVLLSHCFSFFSTSFSFHTWL